MTVDPVQFHDRMLSLGLARVSDPPDVILTSPLVRAVQTAKITGEVLGADVQLADVIGFQDVAGILAMVRRRPEDHDRVVVFLECETKIVEVRAAVRRQRLG